MYTHMHTHTHALPTLDPLSATPSSLSLSFHILFNTLLCVGVCMYILSNPYSTYIHKHTHTLILILSFLAPFFWSSSSPSLF